MGSENRGGFGAGSSESPAALAGSDGKAEAVSGPSTARTMAAVTKWAWNPMPRDVTSAPTPDPLAAPTLHSPCRLDMIGLASRFSAATACDTIATSPGSRTRAGGH